MTLVQRLQDLFRPQEKALVAYRGEIPITAWQHHQLTVAESYKEWEAIWRQNPIVQGCVAAYALTMPEAPLSIRTGDDQLTREHPVFSEVIAGPLTTISEQRLWTLTYTALGLGGNAYWHKRREGNVVRGVRLLTDEVITPMPDGYGDIAYYHFKSGMSETVIPKEDIVHITGFWVDPDMPWKGSSPVALASTSAKSYNEAMTSVYSMLKNDATPRTVFRYTEELSPEQQAALADSFGRKYGGGNRGKAAHIWGLDGIDRLGLDMQELAVEAITTSFEANICSVYRVHPIVAMTAAGLSASTYANFEQASRDFTNYSRVPLWSMIASQIAKGFANEYPDLEFEFDISYVQSLKPSPEQLGYQIIAAFNNGIATQNEAREILGFAPVGGGDAILVPEGMALEQVNTLSIPKQIETKDYHTTAAADDAEWVKAIDDITEDYSATISRQYVRMLNRLEDEVIGVVKTAKPGITTKALGDSIDWLEWESMFLEATETARVRMVADVIGMALADVGAAVTDLGDDYQAVREEGIDESSEKISESIGTIRDEVRETLRQSAGKPADEIESILAKQFENLKRSRAAAVARTTATATAGKTQSSTFKKLNDREPNPARKIRRRWVALTGARDDHRAASGSYEDDNGMFRVGGESTPYPAGPGLSAKNAVNCRCYTRAIREGRR